MRKYVSLLLIAVVALSNLVIINPVNSEITTPSVPEFTLRLAHHPYDVEPMTTIDPYTGKSVTTQAGYHMENRSIEVLINNQPFTPSRYSTGNNITLMYNIRWKGHFENSWNYYSGQAATIDNTRDYVHTSGLNITEVVGGLSWNEESVGYNFFITVPSGGSQGGQVDFQVKALLGYSDQVYAGDMIPLGAIYYYNFTGDESDWSNIQTINISDGVISAFTSPNPSSSSMYTASPSQYPIVTPTQSSTETSVFFGLDWGQIAIILLGITVVVLSFALVLSRRRSSKQIQALSNASVPQ